MQFLKSDLGRRHAIAAVLAAIAAAPVLWAFYWAYMVEIPEGYIFGATGPLTLEEVEANFLSRMDTDMTEAERECLNREVAERARAAGDPETLDPATVELLPAEHWDELDADGRRLILSQVIVTAAAFACH